MRNYLFLRAVLIAFLLCIILPGLTSLAAPPQQASTPESRASETLAEMSPEERIGQLFLVTFQGTDVGPESQIYDLIINKHIGGVVLLAENDNFTASFYNLNDLWILINQLQSARYASSQLEITNPENTAPPPPVYVPLFVGLSQEGDGYPNDQILRGLTSLPSQMSIGATWNTDLSKKVGAVVGQELAAVGINLLLGPSLDVLENPLLMGANELGARSFGGDPYWVGEMGSAYIQGVHEGSNNRMVVVGTHFPGLGSADHIPENEVATVRKSLEQLKQIELAPFFTVTTNAISDTAKVDALQTSHIRYQGLQGNIRSTTRPIGFDQQALGLLMELPELSAWRNAGGVLISDDIGARAVRRFYDPTEQEFNARRLALDAFLAGNDMLYLDNFIEGDDPDSYTTILRTLEFFTQKYREDPLFAERVDKSVLRVLTLKYQQFGFFNLNEVLASGNLNSIGKSGQITLDVAQQGVTLISPSIDELSAVLPETPGRTERIVFISDNFSAQQCSECPEQSVLPVNALSNAVLNLYGPQAGAQVSQFYLRSYSFADLFAYLNEGEAPSTLENDLIATNWIVFGMLNVDDSRPESQALKRFLAEKPGLFANKRVIVFAANSPNYLDSSDIAKITAYFGLFSKTNAFIDTAARVLFKEIPNPPGNLPVSVPGVGYDLILATSPNPNQTIPLSLGLPDWPAIPEEALPDSTLLPAYRVGDTIPLVTGIIRDFNGNPVPNNTPAEFIISVNGAEVPRIQATTKNGAVQAEYLVDRSGTVVIQIVSDLAASETLIFEIPVEETTPEPTLTATSTPTTTPEPTETAIPPTPTPQPIPTEDTSATNLGDWLGAVILAAFIGWGAIRSGAIFGKVRWGIRWGLSAMIGGLLLYTYVVSGLPGSAIFIETSETWGYVLATLIGSVLGWLIAFIGFISTPKGR